MNTSTQLKALIRNISKEKSVQAEIILRNFMLERLLERISLSSLRDKFILKEGMLIAAMVGIDTRSTMDMDATIRGIPLSEGALTEAMNVILACPVDDGVKMTLKGFENIRDESEYSGIRATIEAILDKTRQIIKIDITTGDKVTPRAVEYSFSMNIMVLRLGHIVNDKAINTHEKVRDFQNRLYLAAKTDRKRKFYALYDKTYRKDILEEAWKRVKQKGGAGGVDKVSIEDVKAYGEEKLLDEIAEELRTEKYRCKPVRRTYIHKPDGRKEH